MCRHAKTKFEILSPRIGFISSNSSFLCSYISLDVLLFKLNSINSTLLHLIFWRKKNGLIGGMDGWKSKVEMKPKLMGVTDL